MGTLLTLLFLIGLVAYFMFFWSPGEAETIADGFARETNSISSKAGYLPLTPISGSPMQIQSQLTKTDYSKLLRYTTFRLRKFWLFYVGVMLIIALLFFVMFSESDGIPVAFVLLLSLLISVVISALTIFFTWLVMKILPNRPSSVLGSHTFTITESEFQEANAAGSASMKLELLRRHETKQHIFLFTPMHVGHILPMQDLQAHPEFLKMLRERTRSA